ncbi:MAG: hydrolase [Chloroflexaceae bacterium]
MLQVENSALLVIDVQGKLAQMMHEQEQLFGNLQKMVRGAQVLELPIIVTEQNPEGLGPTIPELAQFLPDTPSISKMSFSCCGNSEFMQAIKALGRRQLLMTGIETHICVYQTTRELLERGYEVEVVTDAVSSRTPANKAIGLQRMQEAGARMTSSEMALYELLQVAEGPQFKEILKLVK